MPPSAPPITPLRLPANVRHLVVYGGSFDPPHIFHTLMPLWVVASQMLGPAARALYVPAARSPLKPAGPVASDEHRLAMLKLALDLPGPRSIWTDEIDRARWLRARGRDEPSYTIDTLRRLRSIVPARVNLRLLIGADQAAGFHRWKDYRAIIKLAEPIVLARAPIISVRDLYDRLDEDAWTRQERAAWCTRMAPNPIMPAASTGLRSAIPGAPADARRWAKRDPLSAVVKSVAAYIIKHNLYGFRPGEPAPARAADINEPVRGDTPAGRAAVKRDRRRLGVSAKPVKPARASRR